VEEQFKTRILESFDPMTQEVYRELPAMIRTEIHTQTGMTRKQSTEPATRPTSQDKNRLQLTTTRSQDKTKSGRAVN
jgi:hypothetical protein